MDQPGEDGPSGPAPEAPDEGARLGEPPGEPPAPGARRRLADTSIKFSNLFFKFRIFLFLLFKGRSMARPYYAHYQITRRCNFRCVSCRVWKDETYAKGLTLEEMAVAARNLRTIGVKSIALTGGEPLLRKDIIAIVEVFKKAGLYVRLQSNAFLLDANILERLFRAGVIDLYLSLDSLDKGTFDHINGLTREDAFEKVLANIRSAVEMSRRFGANVVLQAVLRKENAGEAEALLEYAGELGVMIGLHAMEVAPEDDPMNIRANDPALVVTDEDRKQLEKTYRRLLEIKKAGGRALYMSKRLIEDYREFFADPARGMHWKCGAGRMYLEILPDGAISVCNGTPPIPGYDYRNITQLYASPGREDVFNEFRLNCNGCICTRQLEYITRDPMDLLDKAWTFFVSMMKGR